MEDSLRLAEVLNKQLGLTPYESRAYVSLIIHGPLSPTELARRSSIPRPRAYDVLRSLMEKGLLVEQSGKPPIYASVEPEQGLKNLLIGLEMETLGQLEEKRRTIQGLTQTLSRMYEKSKNLKLERSRVWYTWRDSAFIATYSEAIRNCEKEILVASTSLRPPEKEILEAVEYALKNGKSVKVVRQITDLWTLDELARYERVIKAGSQVQYLNAKEIPFRFTVFDERDIILVLPQKSGSKTRQTTEALWVRVPPLAKILSEYFEGLWKKGEPMLPMLEEVKEKKRHPEKSK